MTITLDLSSYWYIVGVLLVSLAGFWGLRMIRKMFF